MAISSILRNFDGDPNIVTIICDDDLTAITTAGYLIDPVILASIELVNNGEFQFADTDIYLISYAPDFLIGFFVRDILNDTFDALAPAGGLANTLQNGDIFVGNAGNIATGVTPSGEIALTNAGVFSIVEGVINNADINAAAAIAYSKLAPLPSADILVGSGANVATAVAMSGDIGISNAGVTAIQTGVIVNADINAAAAIDFSKLAALPSAHILVGDSGNVAAEVAVTGDVVISNAGVTAISSGVIVNADINASAAIDFSKLATLASGNLIVGSAGGVPTSVASSGDVTIIASGATAIGAGKVLSAMISPLVEQYITATVSAAQFKALYDTPLVMIAAPSANHLIVLKRAVMVMTFASAAFTAGGILGFQYDTTVHGAGVAASNTEAAADFFAAASTSFSFNGVAGDTVAIAPFSTSVQKGIYLSNLTQNFATGGSSFVVHLWYSVIPTV